MKRIALLAALILVMAGLAPVVGQNAPPAGRALLPPDVLRTLADEASGELALQNEILLAGVNRNRKPEEYQKGYFETAFVLDRLREYGLAEAAVVDLPVRGQTTWDAEAGELWIVEPERRKIADLKELPASLAGGSVSTDTTAELVYVGPGNRDEHYKDKTLEGKIALVNGSPEMARRLAVEKYGAAGLLGWASSHAEHDRDQVGWNSIRPGETGEADLRLQPVGASGQRAPRRPRARPEGRRPGRRQGPAGPRLQGADDRRPHQGDRAPRRGARLHGPHLRGLRHAGRQRQHVRGRGHPRDGPGPAEAHGRGEAAAAQAVRALPLRSGDLGDDGLPRQVPRRRRPSSSP